MKVPHAVLAAAMAAAAASLPVCGAAAEPIKVGELNSYKVFPAFLEPYKKGMELAVEEVNAAGGVNGKKLELITRDDNGSPGDAVRAAEESVQIHGGYGFTKDYPAEKFFRDVKLTTIGEGTSEILRLVIAREILGRV